MKTRTALSGRADRIPASPIRRLAPFAVAARERGVGVLQLNIGQPDIASPAEMMAVLREFDEPNLAYGPSQGLPQFIDAPENSSEIGSIPLRFVENRWLQRIDAQLRLKGTRLRRRVHSQRVAKN